MSAKLITVQLKSQNGRGAEIDRKLLQDLSGYLPTRNSFVRYETLERRDGHEVFGSLCICREMVRIRVV